MYEEVINTFNLIAEIAILYMLIIEYRYDEAKDLKRAQRKTKTTKKTTQLPTGEVVTEENVESIEQKN